jgi:hypothetical protein
MASTIKADTLQSTTSNVFILNSAGTEYARFNSTGGLQLVYPATLSSTLAVTGATTLSNTLAVTSATTLSSTLAVTGAATLSNTLAVTGATTLSSTLTVSGGNALVTSAAGLGYGTGAGGSVTQSSSRTTGVTLNKSTGSITMVSAAGSTTAATFTVSNTLVAATDVIILNQKSGTNLYDLLVTAVAAGSFNITFRTTSGTATDAPVINFAIIKGVTA